jgi:hypothetical protein
MAQSNLLARLNRLGFPLFEADEPQDANATLADVVKSKDLRLWEGFPVVLANSAEKGLFDYETVKRRLRNAPDKSFLDALILMSLALYKTLNLKFSWADKFYHSLSADKKREFNGLLKKLKNKADFKVGSRAMSGQRLNSTFSNYFRQEESRLNTLLSMKEEFGLEYALSQVFSPKQKELFFKKLKGEKLTKTEKEYFSRAVKKKVLALANSELHRLAQNVLK